MRSPEGHAPRALVSATPTGGPPPGLRGARGRRSQGSIGGGLRCRAQLLRGVTRPQAGPGRQPEPEAQLRVQSRLRGATIYTVRETSRLQGSLRNPPRPPTRLPAATSVGPSCRRCGCGPSLLAWPLRPLRPLRTRPAGPAQWDSQPTPVPAHGAAPPRQAAAAAPAHTLPPEASPLTHWSRRSVCSAPTRVVFNLHPTSRWPLPPLFYSPTKVGSQFKGQRSQAS